MSPTVLRVMALSGTVLCASSCGADTRRSMDVAVSAAGIDPVPFYGPGDVEVTLSVATVDFANIRLEQPGESARLRHPRPPFTLVRSAHAHPGHEGFGDTTCELLGSWHLDLLSTDGIDLGAANCLEGDLATGRLLLSGTPAVLLKGTATLPEGDVRSFDFEVDLDQEATGIPISATLDADDPPRGIRLTMAPSVMLNWADWGSDDTDGDGVLTLADDLLVNTVPFGVLSTSAYALAVDP